jgi:hypothetical protein
MSKRGVEFYPVFNHTAWSRAMEKAGKAVKRLGEAMRVQLTPDDELSPSDLEWKRQMRYEAEIERQRRIGQAYVRGLARKLEKELGLE